MTRPELLNTVAIQGPATLIANSYIDYTETYKHFLKIV